MHRPVHVLQSSLFNRLQFALAFNYLNVLMHSNNKADYPNTAFLNRLVLVTLSVNGRCPRVLCIHGCVACWKRVTLSHFGRHISPTPCLPVLHSFAYCAVSARAWTCPWWTGTCPSSQL